MPRERIIFSPKTYISRGCAAVHVRSLNARRSERKSYNEAEGEYKTEDDEVRGSAVAVDLESVAIPVAMDDVAAFELQHSPFFILEVLHRVAENHF